MKQHTKLSQKQEHVEEQQTQANTASEFASSEELLRFDATHTEVPPEIAARLQKSAADIRPRASRSWWKNVFGG